MDPTDQTCPPTGLKASELLGMLHATRGHLNELLSQNAGLRQAKSEWDAMRSRYYDLYEIAPVGYVIVGADGLIREANLTASNLLGYGWGALLQWPIRFLILEEDRDDYARFAARILETGLSGECEVRMRTQAGGMIWTSMKGVVAQEEGRPLECHLAISDITARKREEAFREMSREVLGLLLGPEDLPTILPRVLDALKAHTGFDAVGIRLQDGEDFPYFAQQGFSADFLLTENSLVARDATGGICRGPDGRASLECTCGLVISGRTDPAQALFTPGGSAWTNDSFPLLKLPAEQDPRLHPRNQCIHQGYASVALVPIRSETRILGLLQFNDKRKNQFTPELLALLEELGERLGTALRRRQAEEQARTLAAESAGARMALQEVIEEKALAEQNLKESEENHRLLFESVQDAILLLDAAARIRAANPAAVAWLGRPGPALAQLPLCELCEPAAAARLPDILAKLRERGRHAFALAFRRPDGGADACQIEAWRITLEGQFGAMLICRPARPATGSPAG